MDLDKEFVLAVSQGGIRALQKAQERGITVDHLFGEGRFAFEYLVQHRKDNGSVPSAEIILGRTGIALPMETSEKPDFWIQSILDRRLFQVLREGAANVTDLLSARDHKGATEVWTEIHRKLTRESLTLSKVESLLALGKDVIAYYDDIKAGRRGIPTPWPTMDEQTMGWWQEDLVLFAGRLGMGKTWTLLLVSHAAWKGKKKVLIASTEMNKVKMALRFFAMHFKLSYEDVRKGKLGEFAEKKLKDGIVSMLDEQGMSIVGGDFDFTIDNLEGAVEDSDCEMAAIDGAYLIKNSGKDRHERVSNTFDDMKRIAKRRRIAVIANTQLNRSAKKGEGATISAENVAITDVAGWNSDIMYGLNQTADMRNDSQMEIIAMKIREGKPSNMTVRWDLDRMDFSELDENGLNRPKSLESGAFEERIPGADDASLDQVSGESDRLDDLPF